MIRPRRYRASSKLRPRLPMGFYVCAAQCSECLFTDQRIVSGRRAADVIRSATAGDRFFECHKHSLRAGVAAPSDTHVCCRAFYDRMGDQVWPIRYARMTGGIVLVDEQGRAVEGEGWGPPPPPRRRHTWHPLARRSARSGGC